MRVGSFIVAAVIVLSGTSAFSYTLNRHGFRHTRNGPRLRRRSPTTPRMLLEHLAAGVAHGHAGIFDHIAAGVAHGPSGLLQHLGLERTGLLKQLGLAHSHTGQLEKLGLGHSRPGLLEQLVAGASKCGGDLLAGYKYELATHFQATTCIQSFVLVGLGDTIAQGIEGKNKGYEPLRTAKMATLGLLVGGFGTSNWLMFLESQLPGHAHWQTVLEKASLDAGVWAPVANGAYLFLVPLLDGASGDEALTMAQKEFFPVMRTEVTTFLPYNLLSFALIPPQFRPFTTGFVSMCFAVYMSAVSHSDSDTAESPSA